MSEEFLAAEIERLRDERDAALLRADLAEGAVNDVWETLGEEVDREGDLPLPRHIGILLDDLNDALTADRQARDTLDRVHALLPKHGEGWPRPERTFVWADELRAALDPVAVVANPRDGDAATAPACTCPATSSDEDWPHVPDCPARKS